MPKTFASSLIALLLATSLLSPSLFSLINADYAIVLMVSLDEEENESEKEAEKKVDEQSLFLNNEYLQSHSLANQKSISKKEYLFHLSDFKPETLVPPPRISFI